MIKILFLAANPIDTDQLRLDEEMRAIDAAMRQGKYRDHFDLRSHWAVRIDDLQELLMRHQPHIVHFSGHGSTRRELLFQDDKGKTIAVSPEALSNLFGLLKDNIRCVVLNACYTDDQASSIAQHIDCVVGMSDAISDEAALSFALAFYRALAYGRSVKNAFELGCSEIDLRNLKEQHKPKLLANRAEPSEVIFPVDDVLVKPAVHSVSKRMAPKPPVDFVPRPKEYDALRELLLAGGNAPVGITAAIRGAGGYGKTTLAQALCHDPAVIAHFPDGIFWVELAQEPGELTGRVLNLVENLIDRRPGSTTLDAATGELIKALGDKKLLLVIDDAWQAAHVAPFLQGGPHCTRLLTTRVNTTLPPEAPRINVDAMQSNEATQLLGAGLRNVGAALDKLAKRLGEWPLLLRIMNAILRERIGFGQDLKKAVADVDQELSEEGLGAFQNTASASERHVSVTATLSVSLRLLPDNDRQHYHQLAIFPEDVDIPLITVAQLWGVSPREAKKLCFRLADLALLLRFDLVTNTIRLHDVIRTYLCQVQPNLAELHRILLDSYKLADWTALPTGEPYLWDRLAYHLIQAQRTEELTTLFANDRWLQVRVTHDVYLYDGYLADLNQSWQQVHATVQQQIEAGEMPTAVALSVHHALIRTSINSLSSNYEPALVARALVTGLWSPERALSTAYKVSDSQKRVEMIIAILNTHQCNEQQYTVAQTVALEAALAIQDEGDKATTLSGLVPHLSGEQRQATLTQALAAALAIQHGWTKAYALSSLAPHLSGEQRQATLTQALETALVIQHEMSKASALSELAPHLSGAALQRALAAALAIQSEGHKASALSGLAPHLSREALQQALEAALAIQSEWYKASALSGLAPHLSGEALQSALAAALAIQDERDKARVLSGLAPHLSGEALQRALEAALALRDERSKANALSELAPHLSGEALQRALAAAMSIQSQWHKASVLSRLAPHLSGEALQRALAAVLAIRDEWHKASALSRLAPHLSGEALQRALAAVLAIRDEWAKASALSELAPHLSGEQRQATLTTALEAALALHSEGHKAGVLSRLAPHLSGAALQRGLEAALTIPDEWAKANALSGLAAHLSGEQRQEALTRALEAALAIQAEGYKISALSGLTPHLSGEQRQAILTQALEAALAIWDERSKASALSGLAPHLSVAALQRALEAALAIWDERSKASALSGLAPHLSVAALQRALEAALAIQDERSKASALCGLAPHLSVAALQRALEAALAIQDEGAKASALSGLAPHLSGEQQQATLAQALEAALAIWDEWLKAIALSRLAPHLSGAALQRALEAALAMRDEWAKASALSGLAAHLSVAALQRALAAALAIRDEGTKATTLAKFLPYISKLPSLLGTIHKTIADHLWKNLPTRQRQAVLSFLANETLFQPSILDQNTLAAIARSISEICFEWRWL